MGDPVMDRFWAGVMSGMFLVVGLVFVFILATGAVAPSVVCASVFNLKTSQVSWYDGKCWKRDTDTPLTLAQ